jgi:hypothetical protein
MRIYKVLRLESVGAPIAEKLMSDRIWTDDLSALRHLQGGEASHGGHLVLVEAVVDPICVDHIQTRAYREDDPSLKRVALFPNAKLDVVEVRDFAKLSLVG